MFLLLVELLRSRELLDLAITGAWFQIEYCLFGRLELGHLAMELGLFELGMEYLRELGGPANAVSISLGKGGQAGAVVIAIAAFYLLQSTGMDTASVMSGQAVRL